MGCPMPDAPSRPPSLSEILREIAARDQAGVSVGELMECFGGRAMGALLLVFGLICTLPLPPGGTTIFGAPLMLLAPQLMLGDRAPWLPAGLRARTLATADLRKTLAEMSARGCSLSPLGGTGDLYEGTSSCEAPRSRMESHIVLTVAGEDPYRLVITSRGEKGSTTEEITARREQSQPIREKTGGSTFKNPPGHSAWKLVDEAGWRGKPFGGAMFSPLHANFLINTGEATAADLEGLGEAVRADVLAKTGVQLDWEVKRIGRPAP